MARTAGRRTCEPRPLAQDGQIRPAAPVMPQDLGPGRQIVSQDNTKRRQPNSEVRPGPRPPTLRTRDVEAGEAEPEALPTSSLPNIERW
jgi:hypothetical protein